MGPPVVERRAHQRYHELRLTGQYLDRTLDSGSCSFDLVDSSHCVLETLLYRIVDAILYPHYLIIIIVFVKAVILVCESYC